MTKPYYSKINGNYHSASPGMFLFLPDLQRELNSLVKKDIAELKEPFFQQIATSYQYAHNSFYSDGLKIWRNVIKVYYELVELCVQFGRHQEMYELYGIMNLFLSEGQQELFYCNEQIESANKENIEILLKVHCDKYHTIYESLFRYSITLASYCLDIISENNDVLKEYEELCKDDVSYKIKKIKNCKSYTFNNDLLFLSKGVRPIIRNSIAHKTFEYLENNSIKFINRKEVLELKLFEIKTISEELYINYLAQFTAITLFAFDNIHKIDIGKIKRYSNDKQLRIIIDQEFRRLSFNPSNIEFQNDLLKCEVNAPLGWNSPREIMGNLGEGNFYQKSEPVNLKETILSIIYYFAELKTRFKKCQINVLEFATGELIGYVIVNLAEWTKLYDGSPGTDILDKHIIRCTLK